MSLAVLFLDLNSYFASVEQQVQPSLRGKPIAVAPITGDSGCCIAVSYEAKKFGVKTGTRVGEARALCPGIEIVDSRPRLYVIMHHRVLKAIDRHIPVEHVHSIDEVSCRLDRTQRTPDAARALAASIKSAIRETCGVCMRCSIGIAPNRVLAKLGTDMMKPDGLVIIERHEIAARIGGRPAQDLAGIGPKTMRRLERHGIRTIGDLLTYSEKELTQIFGGVIGGRWWHWLRGHELRERATRKRSIGHQHVLAPDLRTSEGARGVAFRLLLKAAARMRHDRYAAGRLTLGLNFVGSRSPGAGDGAWGGAWGGTSWSHTVPLGDGCADSASILDALAEAWNLAAHHLRSKTPMLVSVTLHDLVNARSQTLPLFTPENKSGNISKAMDTINKKFGANTLYTANIHGARGHGTGGIAFSHVPDLEFADSVQSRQRGVEPGREGKRERFMRDEELEGLIEEGLGVG